jgi:hypothetical protein
MIDTPAILGVLIGAIGGFILVLAWDRGPQVFMVTTSRFRLFAHGRIAASLFLPPPNPSRCGSGPRASVDLDQRGKRPWPDDRHPAFRRQTVAEHFQPKDYEHAAHKAEANRQGHRADDKPGRKPPAARKDDDPVEQHPKSPRREQ